MEIAVGYFAAWAFRKARRVAGAADAEVDRVLDAGMARVHDLVSVRLGEDSSVRQMAAEIEVGREEPTERTRRRVEMALEEAMEADEDFADRLSRVVDELERHRKAVGGAPAGDGFITAGGNVEVRADNSSLIARDISGTVNLGNPTDPGPALR
ncbi:hypothetical protein [Streptomyces sp. NPDC001678]|uniref:hypothetical protein n=1 Tax=Streptomyces sp. NPDC001678 TaxID=3364599 RepID=UPI00369132FD